MKKTKNKKFKRKEEDVTGLSFVGCLFIGLGIGLLYGNAGGGVLIGLGAGFIVMAFLKYFLSKEKKQ